MRCLRCAGAPRRPASGSELSLLIPSWHAVLSDPGEFDIDIQNIRCRHWPSPIDHRLSTPDTPAIRFTRAVDFVASLVRFRYSLPGCSPPCTRFGKVPPDMPAFQPYWGKPAVRNDREDRGNVGIIRSPIRAQRADRHSLACGRCRSRPIRGGIGRASARRHPRFCQRECGGVAADYSQLADRVRECHRSGRCRVRAAQPSAMLVHV